MNRTDFDIFIIKGCTGQVMSVYKSGIIDRFETKTEDSFCSTCVHVTGGYWFKKTSDLSWADTNESGSFWFFMTILTVKNAALSFKTYTS